MFNFLKTILGFGIASEPKRLNPVDNDVSSNWSYTCFDSVGCNAKQSDNCWYGVKQVINGISVGSSGKCKLVIKGRHDHNKDFLTYGTYYFDGVTKCITFPTPIETEPADHFIFEVTNLEAAAQDIHLTRYGRILN
jgi:hypothetical protein